VPHLEDTIDVDPHASPTGSSLVLDVRSLPRRPGSMSEVTRQASAPADLGVAMARVREGSPIELDIRLESVMDGVLVTGTADLEVSAECSRCLDPIVWDETVKFTELFTYPATDARGARVQEIEEDDDPLPVLEDDLIDLEPLIRDAVVLDLPLVRSAPKRLNRAGIGDILSCHTGLYDWRLATDAGHGHPWHAGLAGLGATLLDELEAAADEVAAVSDAGVRFLAGRAHVKHGPRRQHCLFELRVEAEDALEELLAVGAAGAGRAADGRQGATISDQGLA
jgi:uncharacterized metal-binding protein YceD (DUF177 family)